MKEKEIKTELEKLVNWVYKSSFVEVFNYNRATQERTMSQKTEEKINRIIKFIK